eukprot:4842848-Pyramimonas_sp.AAC.1
MGGLRQEGRHGLVGCDGLGRSRWPVDAAEAVRCWGPSRSSVPSMQSCPMRRCATASGGVRNIAPILIT